MGGLHNIEAGTFENSHLRFKAAYRETSKRRTTAMDETLKRISFGNTARHVMNDLRTDESSLVVGNAKKTSRISGAVPGLVRNGPKCSLRDLVRFHENACSMAGELDTLLDEQRVALGKIHPEACTELSKQCELTYLETLCTLLRQELSSHNACSEEELKIQVVKSGFIEGGHSISNSKCFDQKTRSLRFQKPSLMRRQRILATCTFQNRPRFSFVALESENGDVWIGQVQALLRLQYPSGEMEEQLFIRYMDVVPPNDGVESALDCVMLRWSAGEAPDSQSIDRNADIQTAYRVSEGIEVEMMTPWLGLAPFHSVLSDVHVVRYNYSFPVTPERLHWIFHRFCVNRFYYQGSVNLEM